MARGLNLLSAQTVKTITREGRHADGGGLYLVVRKRGEAVERLWVFRYSRGARAEKRDSVISLGPARDLSLAGARELAKLCRGALLAGQDPRAAIAPPSEAPTFGQEADDYIDSIEPGMRNAKHVAQWRMTLGEVYCKALREKKVDQIGTEDILAVLKPIWLTKPETAQRIRGRIERVLDAAKVRQKRSGENPARWRGHLEHLLPSAKRLVRGHHAAVPWRDMPAFMRRLTALDSVSALALEWTILTCARTGETIGATWPEIDLEQAVWIIPATRMKAHREHRVPLSPRCLEILEEAKLLGGAHIFPARKPKKALSIMAMAECLKGLDPAATVHGFRSSFRDWVSEATSFPGELAEAALAHVVKDKTERAYRRGDALERRRELMAAWERFCLPPVAENVVSIRR
jgi:integrase